PVLRIRASPDSPGPRPRHGPEEGARGAPPSHPRAPGGGGAGRPRRPDPRGGRRGAGPRRRDGEDPADVRPETPPRADRGAVPFQPEGRLMVEADHGLDGAQPPLPSPAR